MSIRVLQQDENVCKNVASKPTFYDQHLFLSAICLPSSWLQISFMFTMLAAESKDHSMGTNRREKSMTATFSPSHELYFSFHGSDVPPDSYSTVLWHDTWQLCFLLWHATWQLCCFSMIQHLTVILLFCEMLLDSNTALLWHDTWLLCCSSVTWHLIVTPLICDLTLDSYAALLWHDTWLIYCSSVTWLLTVMLFFCDMTLDWYTAHLWHDTWS